LCLPRILASSRSLRGKNGNRQGRRDRKGKTLRILYELSG
jgi:hypothetical protein